jgi:predicted aspartyl protease
MHSRLAALAALLCLSGAGLVVPLSRAATSPSTSLPPQPAPPAARQAQPPMRIIADVMIDGRGPFHFMLDTGATQAVIADSTVARLGLHPDPHKLVRVQGVNAHVEAPEVQIDSLILGSVRFRHIDLPVLAGPLFDSLDGILGAQGFGRIKLSVSVLDRRCIIADSPRRPDTPANATTVWLRSQQLPMFSATIAGIRVQVIVDTGASDTLGNVALLAALQKADALQALRAAPPVLDVTPVRWTGLSALTPPLQLGRLAIQPPAVTFGDYQIFDRWRLSKRPAMLLGMDALATLATFSIDYGRLQLQMLPLPGAMLSLQRVPPSTAAL